MKRFILILAIAIAWVLITQSSSTSADREHTLKVYNWADYIDEDVLEEFQEWY